LSLPKNNKIRKNKPHPWGGMGFICGASVSSLAKIVLFIKRDPIAGTVFHAGKLSTKFFHVFLIFTRFDL